MEGLNYAYDWTMSGELWLALVHSKPTEKLSVIRIIGAFTKCMLSGQTENVQREVCFKSFFILILFAFTAVSYTVYIFLTPFSIFVDLG